jgi:hypothetical protein
MFRRKKEKVHALTITVVVTREFMLDVDQGAAKSLIKASLADAADRAIEDWYAENS